MKQALSQKQLTCVNTMEPSGFLHRYFLNNGHKRLHKWVHYFDIYERHFERFRGQAPTVLEIGVMGGGSLAMWKEYFGEGAKIIGLDINHKCKKHEAENIEIFIGSQDDHAVLSQIVNKYRSIDIVLDDGSHVMKHLLSTFKFLYPCLSSNGIYMVEDLHTSYWEEYGGGLKRDGTFIEFTKDLIDEINAVHARDALPISDFTTSTFSISIYDSIVTFEKRPQGIRFAPVTEPMKTS